MNAPWALANEIEEDEDRDIRLTAATWSNNSLKLQIEISANDSNARIWQIRCEDVLEHNLKGGGASTIELTNDHPLLWKFKRDSASAYFNGTPPSALAVVGDLYEAHRRAVGEWLNLEDWLNPQIITSDLLQFGNGLLAQGPLPLLAIYEEVATRHAIEVKVLSPYPPGGRMSSPTVQHRLRNESKALLIGGSFVTGMGWTSSEQVA